MVPVAVLGAALGLIEMQNETALVFEALEEMNGAPG